jgi:UDP-N-acetylmuramoyl-L-alanyl-D-glutamate--2,6-diaminopimelate ligase
MRLDEVIAVGDGELRGAQIQAGAVEITGLAYDSRTVRKGSLFFCVTGFQSDGHDFAAQAVEHGAVALVVERPLGLGVPEVIVSSARAAMGPAAVRFYGDPSAELRVVGVTGTNGKTTTAFLLKALLEANSRASAGGVLASGVPAGGDLGDGGTASGPAGASTCGLLGTVKSVIGGGERSVSRTTPEAIDLQADFRAMLEAGDGACAMEVSSHALELGRADGIHFAAAIFTNLTQDHLDFHPTMEDYFQAKRRLFETKPGVSVVNVGDPYGRRLAGEIDRVVTFAVEGDADDRATARAEVRAGDLAAEDDGGDEIAGADYRAVDLRCDSAGCSFLLHPPGGVSPREVTLPMPGRFNVANALGALAAVHALGVDLDTLIAALERGVSVPGRMEAVGQGQDFAVLVDYAHTPDSLENVLLAARELIGGEHGEGRVVCVFGAGGDRDRGKRPLMGEIGAQLADVLVVTSDNPRSEDPEAIIGEILAGAEGVERPEGAQPIAAIVDRKEAITHAIAVAGQGDVVVIAGKGHEQGQEFANGVKLPFDDVLVAREILRARSDAGVRTDADEARADMRAGAGG